MINRLKMILAVGMLLALANPAKAIIITGVTDPVNNIADLTYSGGLSLSIANISNFDARITGFGFDFSGGSVTGLASVSGTLNNGGWSFATNQSAGSLGSFDAAAITGPNLNGGFPLSGISVGQTGVFTFTGLGDVTFSNFVVRFQRTGANGEGSDFGQASVSVPEPTTLTLLGLGLVGLGFARRRRAA